AIRAMLEQAAYELKQGNFDQAVEGFTACLLVDPDESEALRGRATAHFQLKSWKKAEHDFRKARTRDPQEPENGLGIAMCLAMQDEIYPAIGEFETLVQKHPDFVRGYIQWGILQIKVGAINKGREILHEALKHRPSLAERRLIESTLKEQEKLDKKRY